MSLLSDEALKEKIQKLIERSITVEKEVLQAETNFLKNKGDKAAHGALALSVSQAQKLVSLFQKCRSLLPIKERGKEGDDEEENGIASLRTQLEDRRAALQRLLPRMVALVEQGDKASDTDHAARTAAALRSLLQSRSLLHLEVKKVQGAVEGLAGSSESIKVLNSNLEGVMGALDTAQVAVRQLLSVQSTEDIVLRISVLVFVLVVVYIFLQRGLGLFGQTIYV